MYKPLKLIFGVFSVIVLTVSSWILVHILAIFGVFIAVAYPALWAFVPSQSICFLCRAKKQGDQCPFCKKPVEKNDVSPKSLFSAVANGLLIFLFSVISFSLVFLESKILEYFGYPGTPKTVSFIIPSKGQYRLGEIFPMKIEIVGVGEPINAVQVDLGFNPDRLEVVEVSTEDSFANIFIQKEINNKAGYARLTGGLPDPGYFGDRGVFGTVFFKGKNPGLAEVEFLPSSKVLANDGRGTNVLKDYSSVGYLILGERITPEEEDLQKQLTITSNVLGARSDKLQMTFFAEDSILGEMIESSSSGDASSESDKDFDVNFYSDQDQDNRENNSLAEKSISYFFSNLSHLDAYILDFYTMFFQAILKIYEAK